jgi:hypothetical protein
MSDIIHEIEMEYNGFKLKLKGERDFIDEKIGNMNELLAKVLSTPRLIATEIKNDMQQLGEAVNPNKSAEAEMPTESIREFLNSKKFSNDTDAVIGIAYYLEMRCNMEDFSSKDIEEYMRKAKYTIPKNISQSISYNVTKGNLQESVNTSKKYKLYCLTDTGIKYVESYVAKETSEKSKTTKPRKSKAKIPSIYEDLTREELNIDKYPKVKDLSNFKEKMILAMYIITSEKKGEYFTVNDLLFILSDLFGEKATGDQIQGVFRRETDWFNKIADESNKKIIKYKMLNKAVASAEKIVSDNNI